MTTNYQNQLTSEPSFFPSGSPARSRQSDHHSDLTDSTEEDENFIALLQYKDAHHILNLAKPPVGAPLSPERIKAAYNTAKDQVLTALEQCEASDNRSSGGRNMFFHSQQNYLELKLQALDQAYEELVPVEDGERSREEDKVEKDRYAVMEAPMDESVTEQASPSVASRSKQSSIRSGGDSSRNAASNSNAAARSIRTGSSKDAPHIKNKPEHQREPSEDELDTIDIYFRPSPDSKASNRPRAKSPDHSESSSVTWDGSSIFSMLSKTKQSLEESSVGGLSDVLGPIYNSSPRKKERDTPEKQQTPSPDAHSPVANQSREHQYNNNHSTNRRPPSGINVKHSSRGIPKAQISPTSVTDFPAGIHNQNHYDNISDFNTKSGKAVVGTGQMMKGTRRASPHHFSHEATEAARMGILRALSEDNSECLPLDDDEGLRYLNISNDTGGGKIMSERSATGENRGRFFHGKSDMMPKEGNSLMASVFNEKQSQLSSSVGAGSVRSSSSRSSPANPERRRNASPKHNNNNNRAPSPKSLSSSNNSSRSRQRKDGKLTTTAPSKSPPSARPNTNNNYDSLLLQPEEYSYDAILQSGMEFADELCVAMNSCWAAFDAAASELDRPPTIVNEDGEDSTIFTRESSYNGGDSSAYTTDGESTAFNTMSSFSGTRRSDDSSRNDRLKNRKLSRTTSEDPPPRMLV